ncbi:zinc finger protein 469 [Elgaria multicarinata webbii]|uniref:zinc finger protein 469 n=1 Tax=Elgaria multicarinata webbii TaxID=159646 RepID=UPI002FCCD45A
MMGESQHAYATHETESVAQDKEVSFEQFSKEDVDAFDSRLLDGSESRPQNGTENGSNFAGVKDKEPQNQREAVIRPQQAGKIDFKSLHNRPKFPSDSPWGAVKGSPQSPTGKGRAREKSRRSGKGERGHQQLYRLTISNARPNPTIGIAYPQQKVTPPKKADVGRGPISGSYRFHVPSIPEREVEIQQEDLSFARSFPEAPSSHLSSNYTSPTATARPNHGAKGQGPAGIPHENPGTHGPLHYLEFQGNGNNSWPSPEKSLPGANSGLPAPKPFPFPESGKASVHGLGPLSFQYPFPPLHGAAADPFQGEAHAQDYVDAALASSQASHGAFAFHSSSRDWKEEGLGGGGGAYDNVAAESRTYALAPPQPAQFLPPQAQGHLPCYKGRHEHSTDPNGAISPSGAIDPKLSTFQENPAVFPPSLHVSSMPKLMGKRQPLSKDSVTSQRILDPGSSLRRTLPPVSLPQVHFQNKAYSDPPASGVSPGSVPFEKNLHAPVQAHPRLLPSWEGSKKAYSPMEPSLAAYPSPVGGQLSFGCHSGHHAKKPWQHLHLTSPMPGQNRIERSRKLASQKLPFPLGVSEWDGSGKAAKSPGAYPSKALLTGESAVLSRHDPGPANCSSTNAFCFEAAKDADPLAVCGPRNKSLFFGASQAVPPASSRLSSTPALVLPPAALSASPSNSPLPSPAPNPTSGSTCSSLSSTSSSPNSYGFEDSVALTASPFFRAQCHPKDSNKAFHAAEALSSGAVHYQTADPIKAFRLPQDTSKEDLLYKGLPVDSHFHKLSMETPKGCVEGFEAELPPPPYSSHHLLASSLSSASLDQLDVFLTCKQCDQNFSNLSSFLEHRQFCSSHTVLQGQAKESSRGAGSRKQLHLPPESLKHTQANPGLLLPPEPHLQLLALNKTTDFLADGEGKGEPKDDSLKGSQLGSLAANPLPLSTSDLEIDDAKLDSLITEALNGLGYQSDNPEIDSSFIDVFADEELASAKVPNGGVPYRAKESSTSGKKTKHTGMDGSVKTLSCCGEHPSGDPAQSRAAGKQQGHKERGASWFPDRGEERLGTQNSAELAPSKVTDLAMYDGAQANASAQMKVRRKNGGSSFLPMKPAAKTMSDAKQPKNVSRASSLGGDLRPAKDGKRRKVRSGTWSKELIHKIVQQKNKLHKLHPKSSKAAPALSSLLADRLLPETKADKFGEYEYISESDDERVEYAKRHCRRKLGSRFNGRSRSSFSRRCQGRGGREKEKEPAWRYGPRRDGQEPKRATSKEDCVARVLRRSRQSSTSSCGSTGLSSESSNSPQSTERADSDTEKENEQRKRPLQSSRHAGPLPREPPNVPEKQMVGRSHKTSSDLSAEPSRVDSPITQPVAFEEYQRDSPDISPPRHSKGVLDNSPSVLFCMEDSEQYNRSSGPDADHPRSMPKVPDFGIGVNQNCHRFAAYKGEALKYQADEFVSPTSIGNHSITNDESANYERVDMKCLKKQKEFIAPISCCNDNPIGIEIARKGPHALGNAAEAFYDCKELSNGYDSSGLFSGPPVTEAAHGDNIYLCQEDVDIGSFKQKHHEIAPYEADNELSQVSSPLSFESSSVFGELPVADFDATLYDGMASSKDSYVPFECTGHQLGKMIPFDQQYSSFLQEKDWNLMEEASPVLSEDLAPFHSLSVEKAVAKRYPGDIDHMPLPERMADYNVPFMSGISDDELEIKRLVTELESQLQTSKLNMEEASVEHQTPKHHTTTTENKEAVHPFLPLTLDQDGDGKGLFLMEAEFEDANLLSAKACGCENPGNEKTLLPTLDGKYGSHRDPWPCSVPFSPLQPSMHAPSAADLMLAGPFSCKGDQGELHGNLKGVIISGEDDFREIRDASAIVMQDSHLSDLSDNLGAPSYTDHLIPSPNPLFPKTLEANSLNLHEALPPRADAVPELPPKEKAFDSPAELESYDHQVPCLQPEFGLPDVGAREAGGNLPPNAQSIKDPEERHFHKTRSPKTLESSTPFQRSQDGSVLLEKAEEIESQTVDQSPAPCDKASDGEHLHFDVLTFSKELDEEAEYEPAPQGKAANPLQQLQLFVARTVKNNEEDLLMPCFPVLHPASHLPTTADIHPEQDEESMGGVQSEEMAESPTLEKRKGSLVEGSENITQVSDPIQVFLEPCKEVEYLGDRLSCVTKPALLESPEMHNNVTGEEQHHLEDECSGMGDINMCADGVSLEHSNLSPLSNPMVTSLIREEGTQGGQVTGEVEEDQEEATLAFRNHRKSPLSPGSSEKEAPSCALSAMLKGPAACCSPWGERCHEDQASGTAKAHQRKGSRDQVGQLQRSLSSASSSLPAQQFEDDYLLPRTDFSSGTGLVSAEDRGLGKQSSHYVGGPLDGSSLEVDFSDQKDVLKKDMGDVTSSGFGMPPSEDAHGLTAAEGHHIPLLACGFSSGAEQTAVGNHTQSPSEHREQEGALPFPPSMHHCSNVSPLSLDMADNMPPCLAEDAAHDLAEPSENIPMHSTSSLHSGNRVPSLVKTERSLKLHTNICKSPSQLLFKKKDLSEDLPRHPDHEDSDVCSVRDMITSSQPPSLQGILLEQPLSETDSALITSKHAELISMPQEAKEVESCPQKDQPQPGILSRDVDAQEVPVVNPTKTANGCGADLSADQYLEMAEAGPQNASQNIDSRRNNLENEDSELNGTVEGTSSCMEQEESKGGSLGDGSKTGQPKAKKRNGLPVSCEICSVSFRSKTGLMRHKAVKHQKKKDSASLLDSNLAPLEKVLKSSTQLPRENRKTSTREKTSSSHISKAPKGQPFPKSYGSQRKEHSKEIQEVISKVLSDLNVTSLDITHELQATNRPRKEVKTKGMSSQVEGSDELAPRSRKEPKARRKDREVSAGGPDGFAGKKLKGKARKARVVSSQNEISRSSHLETETPKICSNMTPCTVGLVLTTVTEEQESSSTSAKEQANVRSPSPPRPLTVTELEDAGERRSSAKEIAGQTPLQDIESCQEQAEDLESEGKQHTQERWPSGSTEDVKDVLGDVQEDQDKDRSRKEPESKESSFEEMNCRNQNNPMICIPSPNRLEQSCHAGAAEKNFPDVIVEKASDADGSYSVDSKSWRMEELHPRNEAPGDGTAEPDLQSLFDDDSTFSQLFPRNDHFARRKCTRVYGKRTKKPKPVAEVNTRTEGTADLFTIRMASDLGETSSFCVTREDPCEYDTISIDDALMLDMCHGSKAVASDNSSGSTKSMALQPDTRRREEVTSVKNGGALSVLCQRSPTGTLPSLSSWGSLEKKEENISADGALLSPSMELTKSEMEASPEPPNLEEESYDTRTNEDSCSPVFQTINMEMLNAKFEMTDMCFYSVGEDHLSHSDDECTLGFKSTSVLQGRPMKNKLEEGKQGKTRSDLNLKTKDKQYKCKVCFQWFLTLGELDFHKLTHNPSPPPTCYMCVQRKFSSREQLRDHLKEKHAKNKAGLWACGMCLKEISEVWMYNEHLREHATQFARKGQAQKTVLGLPGCFSEDEAAVTHFLNSIICRKPSKPSKHVDAGSRAPACKESREPREPPGQETGVNKDSLEVPFRTKPPASSSKATAAPSPDPAPKVDGAPKLMPMHPECKDPSRDCHHCGKQFPKPFKLQRHLVVHSLQKIYLCHKCPMFYQETKELRSHLSQEHGMAEETDIKHTTLYACELCADVMHVIKKSFICSTCNYTFSKKEQYDRHMEKHLVGSSKTFRFRGVMRPGTSAKDGEKKIKEEVCPRDNVPMAKKKKVAHHSSSLAPGSPRDLDCSDAPQLASESLLPPCGPLSMAANGVITPPAQIPVKTEDLVGDFPSLLAEAEKSPFHGLSPPPPPAPMEVSKGPESKHIAALSTGLQMEGDSPGENLSPFLDSSGPVSINLSSLAHNNPVAASPSLSVAHLSEKHDKEPDIPENIILSSKAEQAMGMWDHQQLDENPMSKKPELSAASLEAMECKESPKTRCSSNPKPNETAPQGSSTKLLLPETPLPALPLKDKTSSPALNRPAKETPSKKVTVGQAHAENAVSVPCSMGSTEEVFKPPSLKDKALPDTDAAYPKVNGTAIGTKESNPTKPGSGHLRSEAAGTLAKHNHSDLSKGQERLAANHLAKLHPKKRKEHKCSHKGSSASRENIAGDGGKKKKARTQDAARGEGVGGFKRAEWPNGEGLALSPRKRDTHCNKLTPKLKGAVAGGQLKKLVLDQCFQKKAEIRHANGDLRRKKDILGSKAFHHLLAKDPSTSLPSSLNRHRAVQGAKLPDTHNYRTAESQNNLLSQLFGQKLTSFKIPLRRDTSE